MTKKIILSSIKIVADKGNRVLLHKDGTPVKAGDSVVSFRGEPATVVDWEKSGRNRVYVKWDDTDENAQPAEYFVSVFDLEWAD